MGVPQSWIPDGLERLSASLPGHSWRRAREIDLPTQTLALAAQLVLCAAPLLVATSAVVLRAGGKGLGGPVSRYLGLHGAAATDVMSLFTTSSNVKMPELVGGLIVAAVFGAGVAATQQRGYEGVWSLPRAGIRSTWRQLLWVVGLLIYMIAVLNAGRLGHHGQGRVHSGVVYRAVAQFVVSLLFYAWSQHLLLCARVSWRRLMPGAVCMALGTTILVVVSALILPGQITEEVTDYGPVGATFVLSVWLVVLSGVIFGGALLGAIADGRRRPPPGPVADELLRLQPGPAIQPDGLGVQVAVGEQFEHE